MKKTRLTAARAARRSRGYTAVEVLMSMSVLAVGVLGVFSMEKITLASNIHAKNLALATHIGQAWLGVLEADSTVWNASAGSLARTRWLSAAADPPVWFRPAPLEALRFGPEFDELGNPVGDEGHFCVDLRISRLTGDLQEAAGMGLRRVEVRVFWLREHATAQTSLAAPEFPCDWTSAQVSDPARAQMLQFVHVSGAVRQGV